MTHLGFASFASREEARRARRALRHRGAREDDQHLEVDLLRVHEGAVDPLLRHDLERTANRRPTAGGPLWFLLCILLAGAAVGWLLARGVAAATDEVVDGASWAGVGAAFGLLAAVAGVLVGRQAIRRNRAMQRITAALDSGRVVLSVRCADSAEHPVQEILLANGGHYERLD